MLRTLATLLMPALLAAAVTPETTALVINGDSPASLAVGNAWLRQRAIPPAHAVVLRGVPVGERCSFTDYRERILRPLLQHLRNRLLEHRIEAVAFAPDFPIAVGVGVAEPGPHTGGSAALTGLTALAALVEDGRGHWTALDANPAYRQPGGLPAIPALGQRNEQRGNQAQRLLEAKDIAGAAELLAAIDADQPGNPLVLYDLACCQALLGRTEQALASLERAEAGGFTNWRHARKDDDLKGLRGDARFQAVLERMRQRRVTAPATVPLARATRWREDGAAGTQPPDQGLLPAIMLAVTSGDGLGIEASIANLRRAVAADGTRPAGTVYIARNEDVRSTTREWAFLSLVDTLQARGVRAEVVEGRIPEGKADVAGAVVGIADFDWAKGGSTILPGAICEHLTSCGGMLWPGAGQTHITAWLRAGAAGSSGAVEEPYAIQAKFPSPFIQAHYAAGATLIEAFYLSLAGPYQMLIVGEPLCAPWAQPPLLAAPSVGRAPAGPGIETVEVWVDGDLVATVAPGAALPPPAGLCPGTHEQRLVAVGAHGRARLVAPLVVPGAAPSASAPVQVALDGELVVEARGAGRLRLMGLAGELAAGDGPQARLAVPAARLGLGHPPLWIEAVDAGGRLVGRSAELAVAVTAVRQPALAAPADARPGALALPVEGEPRAIGGACAGGEWLAKSGLDKKGGAVEAWFQVQRDGLFQLQWMGGRVHKLALDDGPEREVPGAGWHCADLAAGWHRAHFILGDKGGCELRLGNDGTWPLDDRRVSHQPR
ncbi:MAG: tetratricopeptide repeat protein [Planctomycetes bacterium]|nr:tetratricopeptide repeat protein [Planctomycetota bacterium]